MSLTPEQIAQLDRLEALVESQRLETAQDAIRLLPKTALLATLGRPRFADRWRSLARAIGFDWIELLHRRAEEGCWDLENSTGEFLAFAVFDAQEFYLFRHGNGAMLFGDDARPQAISQPMRQLRNAFDDWCDRANDVRLDDASAANIVDYTVRYPIPEHLRLSPLANPTSEWMRQLLPPHGTKQTILEVTWPRKEAPALVDARRREDTFVSNYLKAKLDQKGTFMLPDGTSVVVSRSISPSWVMQVSVTSPDLDSLPVRSVRLGTQTAVPGRYGDTRMWRLYLQEQGKFQQDHLLREPLIILFTSGCQLRIAGE